MKKKLNWQAILSISAAGFCLLCCLGTGFTVRFAPNIYQIFLNTSSLHTGDEAPDFELKTLDGETARLSDYRGAPVLLTFASTWCPGCRLEAPRMEEVHKANPELVVLLVDSEESPAVVREFAEEFGLTHPILLDESGSVSTQYQIVAIPTSLFIDADGVIRAKNVGEVTAELLDENLSLIGIQP